MRPKSGESKSEADDRTETADCEIISDAKVFLEEVQPLIDRGLSQDAIAKELGMDEESLRPLMEKMTKPYCQRDGPELFRKVREVISKHYHFEKDWHYVVTALFVFESKCASILPAVFYLFFGGAKGSGKTNILDLLRILTNGVMCENISVKALAEHMKSAPAVFIDEIEADRGDLTDIRNAMLRQGYKRTAAPYRRWDMKTNSPIEVPIYGPKAGTYRGELGDDALLDRGFNIPTAKVPGEEGYSYVLRNFWPEVDQIPRELDQWGRDACEAFNDEELKKSGCSDKFKEKVRKVVMELGANRESELVSIALLIAEVIGVDIVAELHEAAVIRPIDNEEIADELDELREVIVNIAQKEHQTVIDDSPIIKMKQSIVRKKLNEVRAEKDEDHVSTSRLKLLREELGVNRTMLRRPGNATYWYLPEHFVQDLANKVNLANITSEPGQTESEVSQVSQVRRLREDFAKNVPYDDLVATYGAELVEREKIPKHGGRG